MEVRYLENVINFDLLKEYDGTLKEVLKVWQKQKSYSVGDTVQYKGNYLKCITAGTSGTTTLDFTDLDVGDTITDGTVVWEVIEPPSSGGGISIWQANTAYNVNDVVIDSNLIWQCATAHTSTTTFDESKWVCISGGEISNGMEIVDLWSGTFSFDNSTQGSAPTSSTPTIELSDSIQNYEYLLVGCGILVNNIVNNQDSIITPTSVLSSGGNLRVSIAIADSEVYSAVLAKYDNTHLYMRWKAKTYGDDANIISIQGIRKAKPIVSSGMKYETLWEGEAGSLSGTGSTTINLSDNVNKYQKLGLSLSSHSDGGDYRTYYVEVNVTDYLDFITNGSSGDRLSYGWWGNADYYFEIKNDSTSTQLSVVYRDNIITKIIGISEGVQIPTGVQAARVTLCEGSYGSEGSSVELSDSITNYDQLIFTINGAAYSTEDNYVDNIINIDDNTYNKVSFRLFCSWFEEGVSFNIKFIDATHFTIVHKNASSWATGSAITRVVGIKYIQPDSYSTEEKLIGTWIDGKPLYRKTIQIDNLSIQSYQRYDINTTLLLDNDNISIVNIFGGYYVDYGTSTQQYHPWGQEFNSSSNQFSYAIHYRQAEKVLAIIGSWGGGSKVIDKAYVSVEYTKN